MGNFDSNVGDASVATPRVENIGLHTEVQQQLQQSSVQDKKPSPKEPQSGFLDFSGDVYGTKPAYDKKNSESTSQTHQITPEEYKKMAEVKQAIARKMEQHEFTPEELKNQELKRQQIEKNGGKLGEIGTKDGDKATKELTPEQWAKLKAMKLAAEGEKSTKDVKDGMKGEPADKLTPEQWAKLKQMKLDAEAAHGKKGTPVDANGNEKKPIAGNKPEGKPEQVKPDGKPEGKPEGKPADVKPGGKPEGKPENKPNSNPTEADEGVPVRKPWNIDPGHSKPKPTEKPQTPKVGE